MYTVQCTLYNIYIYIVYIAHVILNNGLHSYMRNDNGKSCELLKTIRIIMYIVCSIQCTLYIICIVHCTLHIIHCKLYSKQCTVYIIHYTVYNVN